MDFSRQILIWGDLGQTLLEVTPIVIESSTNDFFFERVKTLLKSSGCKNILRSSNGIENALIISSTIRDSKNPCFVVNFNEHGICIQLSHPKLICFTERGECSNDSIDDCWPYEYDHNLLGKSHFTIPASTLPCMSESNSFYTSDLLNEYFAAAYLTAEIQKLCTHQFVPESRQALNVAQELKATNDVIKILDTLAACKERTGNLPNALIDAQKIIRTDPTNPIGYLRTAKILIALKAPEDAYNIYRLGIKRASPKSQFYTELKKRFEALETTIPKEVDPSAKGQLSSLPFFVFVRIFGLLSDEARNNLACTQKKLRFKSLLALLEQPSINLDKYKQKQFIALLSKYDLLKNHKLLCCSSQSNEFLLLIVKFIHQRPAKRIFFSKLALHINHHETQVMFLKALKLGLRSSLKCLKLTFDSGLGSDGALALLKSIFNECELRSLSINDLNGVLRSITLPLSGKSCSSLLFLHLESPINLNLFSRCINLLELLAPAESRISHVGSDKLAIVHARFSSSNDGIVPLPIKHLKLSNAAEQIRSIDFTQYSYLALQTICLESVSFGAELPLFNPNWCQLRVLRLNQVHFYHPQPDLTAILKNTKSLQVLEISQCSLAHLSDFDVSTAGLWLVNLIFSAESLCSLEHLILGRLQLAPASISAMSKGIKEHKLARLKILGLIEVITNGVQMTPFYKLYKHAYPNSYLLINAEHETIYNQEYNLFKETTLQTL